MDLTHNEATYSDSEGDSESVLSSSLARLAELMAEFQYIYDTRLRKVIKESGGITVSNTGNCWNKIYNEFSSTNKVFLL